MSNNDEFMDDPPITGEDPVFDSDEDEWDDYGEDEFDNDISDIEIETQSDRKKKSANFNRIVIGATVAVGFVVMMMQMGGGGGQPQQAGTTMVAANGQETQRPVEDTDYSTRDVIYGRAEQQNLANQSDAPESRVKGSGGGLLNDPALVKSIETDTREATFDDIYFYNQQDGEDKAAPRGARPQVVDNAPPMPAPILSDGPAANQADNPSGNDVLTPMNFDNEGPAPKRTVMEDKSAPQLDDGYAADGDDFPAERRQSTAASSAIEERLGQILDRLDDMESRLETINIAPAQSGEMKKLSDSLSRLEKRFDALENAQDAKPAAAKATSAPAKKAATVKSPAPKPAVKAISNAGASRPSTAWILRSAQPGRAMVAKPGSNETYSVSIGDSLAGIGEVLDVYYENGRWVVRGSKGRIIQ